MSIVLLSLVCFVAHQQPVAPLRTVAESSDYTATSRYEDVTAFLNTLKERFASARFGTLGESVEKRALPYLVIADPPIAGADAAKSSGKVIVFAFANIHAGEVDGKEALLALARDLLMQPEPELLKKVVIVLAPIFNADGNEQFSPMNRTEQNGPRSVGKRTNAQGFDLNRDFVKLESPEVRSLVAFLDAWQPHVVVDMHTTNGSYHRYTLTYDGPRHPLADPTLRTFSMEKFLPEVGARLQKATGYESFLYGNFNKENTVWEMYPAQPRYGIQYVGMRGGIGILSESYSYAPFKDRVRAGYGFVKAILDSAAQHHEEIKKIVKAAAEAPLRIPLRTRQSALPAKQSVKGYIEERKDGKVIPTKPKDYDCTILAGIESTLVVTRPEAYLFPATYFSVKEVLQRHGIVVEELREDIELPIEQYRVSEVIRATNPFQKHRLTQVEATAMSEVRRFSAGTFLVRTDGRLGGLAAYLLEPQSEDGLTTWNFFDEGLKANSFFPVVRLPKLAATYFGPARPLADNRPTPRKITLAGPFPNLNGSVFPTITWEPEGTHFRRLVGSQWYRIDARTGRSEPSRRPDTPPEPKPITLPKSAGERNLLSYGKDRAYAVFIRNNNLWAIDIAAGKEVQLTTDGSADIRHGIADWVYEEEIFLRNPKAYWWSPEGKRIAYLSFDDRPVGRFTIIDHLPTRLRTEIQTYPKAGDPNPLVSVSVADLTTMKTIHLPLPGYDPKDTLVIRLGWTPDGSRVWGYVQNRTQTWLDVLTWPREGGAPTKLFRDQTRAWVEDPGDLTFLKDGSFLFFSERTGWKHLYHYDAGGNLLKPITSGEWEVRSVLRLEEEIGTVSFMGTKDSHTGERAYRVNMKSGEIVCLTPEPGSHSVDLAPKGDLLIDYRTDSHLPRQGTLRDGTGACVRTLFANPVYERENYRLGSYERVRIKTKDGYEMEASMMKPADFEPTKTYPVWLKTYAGPHTPTISDTWSGGRLSDQALANEGLIVFRVDPRPASGKGAVSAWTAYKQLGVQELKDLEEAVDWLCSHPWADRTKVGISGHSYGGYMAAYTLTHSTKFAAGIASAPVTDWRNYDTIYTERYMGTPQENPNGYDVSSVVKSARNLHGRLLIIHGMMDDNVHPANSMQLIDALQRFDKRFDVMFYPQARHGIGSRHYSTVTNEFMFRELLGRR